MQPLFPAELLAEQQRLLQRERFRDDRLSRYGLDAPDRVTVDRRQPHPDPLGMMLMKIQPRAAIGTIMAWGTRAVLSFRGEEARP